MICANVSTPEKAMSKEKPLYEKIYHDEVYIEFVRLIGYQGCTYRDMIERTEPLRQKFGNPRIDSATYFLVAFEGDRRCNPQPLVHVSLRPEVRKLCWQLLGPPPEDWDTYYRNADGSPDPQHAEKMAELARMTGKPQEKKTTRKKKSTKK
jgi:hypothetical protein